jgi:hypothetical protein
MSDLRQFRLGVMAAALTAACSVGTLAQSLPGASADGVSGSKLEIAGTAPEACIIATPTQETINNATLVANTATAQVTVTQLVDPNTAIPQAAVVNMAFPVVCNTAHSLTITARSGGLVLQASAPPPGPGFRNHLDYQVSADWAGQQTSQLSSGAPVQITSNNAASGQLFVTISIPAGGVPLEAGTYSDSLIVNLQPAS